MQRFLSEYYINLVEDFIAKKLPESNELFPCISEQYREQAINDWNTINDENTPATSYLQFAESAYGMNSYGFYKSRVGRILLIHAYCNILSSYYIIDPTWHFLKPNEMIEQKNISEEA